MDKNDKLLRGFADIYNKTVWLNKIKMEKELKECTPSEVHCIEAIGNDADSNVTKLAESFFMTRGAISKLAKKLMNKGYIESYQKSDNRKEIYFKLTNQGQRIYQTHAELHKEFSIRDQPIFNQLTAKQMDTMINFVDDYNKHLDEEMKKQNLDN